MEMMVFFHFFHMFLAFFEQIMADMNVVRGIFSFSNFLKNFQLMRVENKKKDFGSQSMIFTSDFGSLFFITSLMHNEIKKKFL